MVPEFETARRKVDVLQRTVSVGKPIPELVEPDHGVGRISRHTARPGSRDAGAARRQLRSASGGPQAGLCLLALGFQREIRGKGGPVIEAQTGGGNGE